MPKACTPSVMRAVVLLLLFAGFSAASAQQSPPTPDNRTDQKSQEQDQDQSDTTLKVNVNVVQLFFNVKDKRGALIPNLTKNDFQILEDGKPQTIKYFTAESNLPLTLGILIDSSGSQARVLDMEKQVGGDFLSQILREKDLAFVIDFDVNVELLQDFTSSVRLLKTALNNARINTAGGSGTGIPGLGGGTVPTVGSPRGTLLYDAVYLASHDELAQQVGRKAMILLTDGQDEGSQLKIKDAIEAAQKSDSIVYVLLCADRGFYGGFGGYSGEGDMKKLTQETGGGGIEGGNKYEKRKEDFTKTATNPPTNTNMVSGPPTPPPTEPSAKSKSTPATKTTKSNPA